MIEHSIFNINTAIKSIDKNEERVKQDGQVRSLRVLMRAQNAMDESTSQGPSVGAERRRRVSFL